MAAEEAADIYNVQLVPGLPLYQQVRGGNEANSMPPLVTLECRIAQYNHRYHQNTNALQLQIMAALQQASRAVRKEAITDADGWTKVEGGVHVTAPDGTTVAGARTPKPRRAGPDNPFLTRSAKKKRSGSDKGPELVDFYKFQHRERKREEWAKLRLEEKEAAQSCKSLSIGIE